MSEEPGSTSSSTSRRFLVDSCALVDLVCLELLDQVRSLRAQVQLSVTDVIWEEAAGQRAMRWDPLRVQELRELANEDRALDVVEMAGEATATYLSIRAAPRGISLDPGEDSMVALAFHGWADDLVTSDWEAWKRFRNVFPDRALYLDDLLKAPGCSKAEIKKAFERLDRLDRRRRRR